MMLIRRVVMFMLILALTATACTASSITPTEPSIATGTAVSTPTAIPVTPHRIQIRVVDGVSEFYDTLTGEKFVPRGADYIHWVARPSPGRGDIWVDALFNTSFGELDQAEAELQQMKALGFNTVRMWKNACWGEVGGCIGDPAGGLSDAYLDNITTFLRLAKKYGIYVIFTDDWVPDDGGYSQELARAAYPSYNGVYLTEHGITAERMYWEDFIHGLIERGAPLDAILAYELKNEAYYELNYAPLNQTSGMVTAANGSRYDMADEQDRIRMMEESWLFWIKQLRNSILDVDPTALVTMGFISQQEPNPVREGDPRIVYLNRVVRESELDFIDFHPYPGYDLSLKEHVENFAMIGAGDKLVLMGEFGADKENYASAERGAAALQAWQVESCKYGFDGWLFWTWGQNPDDEFWNVYEGDGVVATVLAPVNRPDPCAYGEFDFVRFNAAAQAKITASSYALEYVPELAADGTREYWISGGGPPQWIQFDLAAPTDVESIVLTVLQNPPGRSVHQLWVRQAGQELRLVHTFDGVTDEGDVLTYTPEEPLIGVDLVRVVTTYALDVWPGWHEIEILTKTPPE